MSETKLPKLGPYQIVEVIGEGGMCRVFRARRDDLDIDCALKILRNEMRSDTRVRDYFLTEADLSMLVRHPNLIRSYDAGEIEGRAYIAMELLEGGTLSDLQRMLHAEGDLLPDDLALHVICEMLAGLEALHEAKGQTGRPLGIVHRDVTPHNVFLGLDGRVVLGDFGVAHIEAHGSDMEADVPGKLAFIAPESLTKEPTDRRADVYSAGAMLYELLTGAQPFASEDEDTTVDLIVEGRHPRPRRLRPDLPAELESVIERALSRRPKDRPATAWEFREALQPFFEPRLAGYRMLGALMTSLRSASTA